MVPCNDVHIVWTTAGQLPGTLCAWLSRYRILLPIHTVHVPSYADEALVTCGPGAQVDNPVDDIRQNLIDPFAGKGDPTLEGGETMLQFHVDGRTVRHAVGSWRRTARLCALLLTAGVALALIAQAIRG